MDYREAEEIVNGYAAAVARGVKNGNLVRYQSWLPCPKDRIVTAYKIFLAYVIKFKTISRDDFKKHFMILNYIDSFVEDAEAKRINSYWQLDDTAKHLFCKTEPELAHICRIYSDHMQISARYDEVVNYVQKIQNLDCYSQMYCRKIYELANVSYSSRYEKYFSHPLSSVR